MQRRLTEGKGDDVLVRQRNELVLAALDDHQPADVVVVYGPGHIPGLEAGLLERGFVCTQDTWYSVGRILPLRIVLWNMVRRRLPAHQPVART